MFATKPYHTGECNLFLFSVIYFKYTEFLEKLLIVAMA